MIRLAEPRFSHCAYSTDEETESHEGGDLPVVTQPGSGQRVWQPASYLWNSGSEPFIEKGAQALRPHGAP